MSPYVGAQKLVDKREIMAICLVTGGAGFIGSHLVEALVARGDKVRVLDNFCTGILTNLDKVNRDIQFIFGDLSNRDLLQQATSGVDLLFHLATPPWESYDPPGDINAKWACATGTLQVLNAARAAKVRRVIYASSCKIYGHTNAPCLKEDDAVLPDSSYGFAKLMGEMQCLGFTSLYGLETVRLRYSNTFGPRQCPTSPYAQELPLIVKSMLIGHPLVLAENAAANRDFIYVEDVVHATLLAATAPRVSGQVYNIARGRSVSILEIVATVNRIIGTQIQPVGKEPIPAETSTSTVDNTQAETDFGFCPSVDLRQGLLWLIEYYAEQGGFPLAEKVTAARGNKGPHFRASRPASAQNPNEPESSQPS